MRAICLLFAVLAAVFSPFARATCAAAIFSEHYRPELEALIARSPNRPTRVRDAWTLLVLKFLETEQKIRSPFVRHDFLRAQLIQAEGAHSLDFARRVLDGQTGSLEFYAARVAIFARQFDRRARQADAREAAAAKVARFDAALLQERNLLYDPKTAEVKEVALRSLVDFGTTGRKSWVPVAAQILVDLEELAAEELIGFGEADVRRFFPPFLFVGGNTVVAPLAAQLLFRRRKYSGGRPTFAIRVVVPPMSIEGRVTIGDALTRIRNTVAALEETQLHTAITRIEIVVPENYTELSEGYKISTRVAVPNTSLAHLVRPDGREQTIQLIGDPMPVLVRVLDGYR